MSAAGRQETGAVEHNEVHRLPRGIFVKPIIVVKVCTAVDCSAQVVQGQQRSTMESDEDVLSAASYLLEGKSHSGRDICHAILVTCARQNPQKWTLIVCIVFSLFFLKEKIITWCTWVSS